MFDGDKFKLWAEIAIECIYIGAMGLLIMFLLAILLVIQSAL